MAPKRKRIQNPAMANGTDGKGAAASSSTKEPGAGVTAGTAQQAVGQLTAAGQDADVEQAAKKPKVDAWDGRLPSKDTAEDAMHTMQHIIPKVKQTLPQALSALAGTCNSGVVKSALYEVQPLAIKDKISDGEITSFKAPWETQKCLQAVASTGLYEAAVNICWLDAQKKRSFRLICPWSDQPGRRCTPFTNASLVRLRTGLVAIPQTVRPACISQCLFQHLCWTPRFCNKVASTRDWCCQASMRWSWHGFWECTLPSSFKMRNGFADCGNVA